MQNLEGSTLWPNVKFSQFSQFLYINILINLPHGGMGIELLAFNKTTIGEFWGLCIFFRNDLRHIAMKSKMLVNYVSNEPLKVSKRSSFLIVT